MEGHIRTRGSSKVVKEKSPNTMFKKGTYVMAKWKNNIEYLAKIVDHRETLEGDLQFNIVFVWDNFSEWRNSTKLRLATDREVDSILKEIEQLKASGKEYQKKQSSDVPTTSDDPDMIYDANHTQFQEACRRRRERQRRSMSGEMNTTQPETPKSKSHTQSGATPVHTPKHTPVRKSSISSMTPVSPNVSKKPEADIKPAVPSEDTATPIPSAQAPPQTFACSLCTRSFRTSHLLTRHLDNCHSQKPDKALSSSDAAPAPKRRKLDPDLPVEAPSVIDGNAIECYMYCSCKATGTVTEPESAVIQCRVCQVWSHRKCNGCEEEKSWICTHCRREPSGLTDWANHESSSGRLRHLTLPEINKLSFYILGWIGKLRTMIQCGHRQLVRIRNIYDNIAEEQNRSAEPPSDASIEIFNGPSSTDENFGTLDSSDITRLLENISATLPDWTIPDDLNACQPSLSSSSAPSSALDTPTKNIISSIIQSMSPVDVGNPASSISSMGSVNATPTTETTIEADLQRAAVMGHPIKMSHSPMPNFGSPGKPTLHRASNNHASTVGASGDVETGDSLMGFSEASNSSVSAMIGHPIKISNSPMPNFSSPGKVTPHRTTNSNVSTTASGDLEAADSLMSFSETSSTPSTVVMGHQFKVSNSPMPDFGSPGKTAHHRVTNSGVSTSGDIEAADGLMGFPVTTNPSGSVITGRNTSIPFHELQTFNKEIIAPVDAVLGMLEKLAVDLEARAEELLRIRNAGSASGSFPPSPSDRMPPSPPINPRRRRRPPPHYDSPPFRGGRR